MKKMLSVLAAAVMLCALLAGCNGQPDPTEPTAEADAIWDSVKTAVNERNASECLHLTLYLTTDDDSRIDLDGASKANEFWISGENRYTEFYSQGELTPHSLICAGTTYWPLGNNQWRVLGETSGDGSVTIELEGKDSVTGWETIDGQLQVSLKTEDGSVMLRLDAEGKLIWYVFSSEGYTNDAEGEQIPTVIHGILVYNDTDQQQIRQKVETVISAMEIVESAEPTQEPSMGEHVTPPDDMPDPPENDYSLPPDERPGDRNEVIDR